MKNKHTDEKILELIVTSFVIIVLGFLFVKVLFY